MTRVVFDTNIALSFLLSPGKIISKVFYLWETGKITVYYSKETLKELKIALEYPRLQKYLNNEDKINLIEKINLSGIFHQTKSNLKICRDSDDDIFINLAISANVQYLITGDKDLLVLNGNKQLKGLKIVNPSEFVKLI